MFSLLSPVALLMEQCLSLPCAGVTACSACTSRAAVDAGRAVLPHRREGAVWAVGWDWQERSNQSGFYKKRGEPQKRGKACVVALWLSFVL